VSQPLIYNYGIAFIIFDADNQAYTVGQTGSIGPNLDPSPWGSSSDSDLNPLKQNSAEVRDNWRALVAFSQAKWRTDVSLALVQMLEDLYEDVKKIWPYIATAISIFS
jgi:hypothetical protein